MRGEVTCLSHEVMMPCVAVQRSSTLSREPNHAIFDDVKGPHIDC